MVCLQKNRCDFELMQKPHDSLQNQTHAVLIVKL